MFSNSFWSSRLLDSTINYTFYISLPNPTNQPPLIYLVDEHWEKELEAELQDFELVDDEHQARSGGAASSSTDWEKDVEDLLGDCEDLK